MEKNVLIKIASVLIGIGLTSCSSVSSSPSKTPASHKNVITMSQSNVFADSNTTTTWNKLQHMSVVKLAAMQSKTTDNIENGWITLAIIAKQRKASTQQLVDDLMAWRQRNPGHTANQLFPDNATLNQLVGAPPPVQIALLLPQGGAYASSGQAVSQGFLNAYYANRLQAGKQRVKIYDTTQAQSMAALYQQAIADGADFVIGPLVKEQVQQLSVATPLSAPTLALNYTNNNASYNNFYEFGLLPEDEAGQLADRARTAGLSKALVIAPQNAWGQRVVSAFSERWQAEGGDIQEKWYYADKANFNQDIAHLLKVDMAADKLLMRKDNNKAVLEQQRRQDFDVIFLFSQPEEARLIVSLLRYYYSGKTPIYTTSSAYSGKLNPQKDVDLNGVIVCDIPRDLSAKKDREPANRLYAVGQDAYLLSQSLQRLATLPHFPIYATTGALTLSTQHQIHRRLPCVAIRNGSL